MITITRTTRFVLVAAAALAVAAPAASAKPIGPRTTPAVTSTAGYQGSYRPDTSNIALPPDRVDRIGTRGQASTSHPLVVATRTADGSTSFDWTAAAIGAGSVASAVLIAAGAVGLRSRRRMALGV
jgi:hypothetical protein